MLNRRELLSTLGLGGVGAACSARSLPLSVVRPALPPLFDDIERRSFRYFWETTNPANGLVPDRWPTPSAASIAAVGFGLTAYPIGVERGYVTRPAAIDRVLVTLRFLLAAPQGRAAAGVAGYKGFFYHFLDMQTGHRAGDCELSTVDTALLLGGALFCASYFDRAEAAETEIRRLADALYARVDWRWAQPMAPAITHGWTPEAGFIPYDWRGYNEAMLVYILALGAPRHAVGPAAWSAWTSRYAASWGVTQGYPHLRFPPLFGHQYSHVWIDFRGIRDAAMRSAGFDYFENSRRATLAQRAYGKANPLGWKGYDADIWGLTASDGPGPAVRDYRGERRRFHGYAARGAGGPLGLDDGTIAPTAALSSLPFAPTEVIAAGAAMVARYGSAIYREYGFADAFNPSFDVDVGGAGSGSAGWVATDYVGIDQGPIVAMIENERSDLIWRTMRGNAAIRTGLQRAGFTGGWLGAA